MHEQSTLFKTQERESDRRSKEIEQRKESQKTQTKEQGHVTLSTEIHWAGLAEFTLCIECRNMHSERLFPNVES